MAELNDIPSLIEAFCAETSKNSISPDKVGHLLKLLYDWAAPAQFAPKLGTIEENINLLGENLISIDAKVNQLDSGVSQCLTQISNTVNLHSDQSVSGCKTFKSQPVFEPGEAPPFVVKSNWLVPMLNADMLDGLHASDFYSEGDSPNFDNLSVDSLGSFQHLTATGISTLGFLTCEEEAQFYDKAHFFSPMAVVSSFTSNSVTSTKGLEAFKVGSSESFDAGWGTYMLSYGNGRGLIQQGSATSGKTFSLTLNPLGGNVGINIPNNDNAQYPLDVYGDVRSRGVARASGFSGSNIHIETDADGSFGNNNNEINSTSGRMWLQYDNAGSLGLCRGGGKTTVYGDFEVRGTASFNGVSFFGPLTSESISDSTGRVRLDPTGITLAWDGESGPFPKLRASVDPEESEPYCLVSLYTGYADGVSVAVGGPSDEYDPDAISPENVLVSPARTTAKGRVCLQAQTIDIPGGLIELGAAVLWYDAISDTLKCSHEIKKI